MVICDSKDVVGMSYHVSLPCLLVSFGGVKELLEDKGACFALILGDIDRKIFLMSVTESVLRPLQHFWNEDLTKQSIFLR